MIKVKEVEIAKEVKRSDGVCDVSPLAMFSIEINITEVKMSELGLS